jgi:signal transduction histidine kinase
MLPTHIGPRREPRIPPTSGGHQVSETVNVRPVASARLESRATPPPRSEAGIEDTLAPARAGDVPVSISTWLWLGLLLAALFAWTILIASTRTFRFNVYWPRARLPIETTGMVVATLTAALGYLRYSLSRSPSSLFLALAFTTLAVNHFVFGILITPGTSGISGEEVYYWTIGRLFAVGLLLLGTLPAFQEPRDSPHPLRSFILGSVVTLALLAIGEGTLHIFHEHLPLLVSPPAAGTIAGGILPGLTFIDLLLGGLGTSLYLVAALVYVNEVPGRYLQPPWLAPALIVAAFSHLHYMLFPTVFTDRISTGDFLRVGFAVLLLIGLLWEVRASFLAERERAEEAARAYETERQRVQELERLERAKADFFNMITHELIHPVAALRGFAVTLTKRWAQLDDETRLAMIERMDQESARLRDLAEDAGTVAYVEDEGFALQLRRERAAELARDAADAVVEMGNRLVVQVDPTADDAVVVSDRSRLLQVFRNLLSNAEKYSTPGTTVQVVVNATETDVSFMVVDSGPGIAQDDIPRLFQRFSRIRAAQTTSVPGSGLGLYITRRIVEAHGGRIWAESSAGVGSRFGFSLPRAVD